MACIGESYISGAVSLCVYRVDIPDRYRSAGADGISHHAGPWLNSDAAVGYFTFDDYAGVWATAILFSDEDTAFAFKMRFG